MKNLKRTLFALLIGINLVAIPTYAMRTTTKTIEVCISTDCKTNGKGCKITVEILEPVGI